MAITRADTLTQTSKKQDLFTDFLDSFSVSPFSGQLALVKNEKAVSQSIKNLILTNFGERLFNPNFGSNIYKTLFEPNLTEDLNLLEDRIRFSIENYEPRAIIEEILVRSSEKTDFSMNPEYRALEQEALTTAYVMPEDSSHVIEVTIVFRTINNTAPITLTVLLKRVR